MPMSEILILPPTLLGAPMLASQVALMAQFMGVPGVLEVPCATQN